jgi:tetratricopeptide (TPR) repeat protein
MGSIEERALQQSLTTLIAALVLVLFDCAQAQEPVEPQDVPAIRRAAAEAYGARDVDTALELYAQLTTADPDLAEGWYGLSRAHEWNGDLEAAIAAGEHAQALGYLNRGRLSYRIAQLYAKSGDDERALDWLDRALAQRFDGRSGIGEDQAFASLRDNPAFRRLGGIVPATVTKREEGLVFDIDYLVEEAQRLHAGLAREAFSTAFVEQANSLKRNVPTLSDAAFYTGLMRLVAVLNDGHSAIYGPGPDSPLAISNAMLPLKFFWFAEGVYIVDGVAGMSGYAGSRVTHFGALTSEEALARLSELRGVDNDMTWKWMGPMFYLGQLELLRAVGATDSVDEITLTLVDAAGSETEQRFKAGPYEIQRKLRPSPAMTGDVPLYLADVDNNYWTRPIPERHALYLQCNQVRNDERQSIAEFAADLDTTLRTGDFDALIVDVRHNNGGNNTLVKPLVQALIAFDRADEDNRILVITGRNTFSAAQNFISRVERWTDAIFVGEPSASSPNFVGEETELVLPWSRLQGSISNRYWQESSPMDHRQWIAPAIPVAPTAADYFSGTDGALEAALKFIEADDQAPASARRPAGP